MFQISFPIAAEVPKDARDEIWRLLTLEVGDSKKHAQAFREAIESRIFNLVIEVDHDGNWVSVELK